MSLLRHNQRAPGLTQLCRVRWVALAVQAVLVLVLGQQADRERPIALMLGALVLVGLSNLWLAKRPADKAQAAIGAVLWADVLALTLLLWGSGGPSNPFSVLYLVHVTLAAMLSSRIWTWLVVASACLGFALLFWFNIPLPPQLGGHGHHAGSGSYSFHLQGMWLALAITAVTIALFVSRLSSALRYEQQRRAKSDRLLGLAALAAGAAHEIGNPLGTIRLAASELSRELRAGRQSPTFLEDVELIDHEVQRASAVLQKMSSAAGELQGEQLAPLALQDVCARVIEQESPHPQAVKLELSEGRQQVYWPLGAVSQAIAQLLRNAILTGVEPVVLRVYTKADFVHLEIEDQGPGMDKGLLARVGEPFLSGGQGMGLGLFIAKSLIEQMGGELVIDSALGQGTRVKVQLPLRAGERAS